MKIVRENINEKFSEESDAIHDMGIGKKQQILKDLKNIGILENDVKFFDDYSFFMKSGKRHQPDEVFLKLQLKHFPFDKKVLLNYLENTSKDIRLVINQAFKDGIKIKDIEYIVKYVFDSVGNRQPRYSNAKEDRAAALLELNKLSRKKKDVEFDDEYNRYVFIGYTDKVPVDVNGKKYYEEKFMAEKMIKLDKYNQGSMMQVAMMKMRADVQYKHSGYHGESGVFYVDLPKFMMDEDYYDAIPEEYRDIIEKYKKKI